ncbi:MAG TPA: hypothetical protein VNS09_24700 [Solirubrobacter sp.]|nr:hypothetical protein [Solirubrobacter sp.]
MKAAGRRAVLAAVGACAVLAAPAQATVRQGAASDPAGDSTESAATDIVAVEGSSDDAAGAAAVTVQTAAAGWSGTWLLGVAGTRASNGACGTPLVLFAADPASGAVQFSRDDGTQRTGTLRVDGTRVTMSGTGSDLAVAFDCATAYTVPANGQLSQAYDRSDTPATLSAPAPAPTATPAPPPPPAPAPVAPPPVPKAAKLTVSLAGVPSTIKRNRTIRLRLRVANDGSKRSSALRVTFNRPRGLSGLGGKARKLGALKPAQKRTLTVKVKLTKRARTSSTLKATVRAGKLKASSAVVLRIGKARKVKPKPGAPVAKQGPLAGTYWWRTVNHVDWAWDNRALYFVDDRTVYSGFPAGGLPATCTTPPAKPDAEIDERDGCLPYTYDEKSGALTIGDKAGTFKPGGGLDVDGNGYGALVPPAPGTRFAGNELEHISFRGMCGLIFGCTVSQQHLSLLSDGQFVLSSSTTSSMGDPGIGGGYTYVGNFPPDEHGTYEVQPGGKIQLTYANGTVRVETFAVDTNSAGAADPVGEGVLLGADNFYPGS